MTRRKIIEIDEELCTGCGECIIACAEGALELRDGKARVISDAFCDGLGACIGDCPAGALRIVEREAEEFDEERVKEHLESIERRDGAEPHNSVHTEGVCCPSARPRVLSHGRQEHIDERREAPRSRLEHWPVQLMLVPENAPFLRNKNLVVIADCTAIAYPDLHGKLLSGNAVVMGCPKFDDLEIYKHKLKGIICNSGIRSISVAHMEVPCCFALQQVVAEAVRESGMTIPFKELVIGIDGEIKG